MEKYELVTDIKKVERLIFEINTIHKKYSEEYFESGKIAKVNLKTLLRRYQLMRF